MTTAHTPGPWKWVGVSLVAPSGSQILWPYNIPGEVTDDTPASIRMGACGLDTECAAEANAHLIAAAPDLLAACKNLRAIVHDYLTHAQQRDCAIDISHADSIISRAEGGQS